MAKNRELNQDQKIIQFPTRRSGKVIEAQKRFQSPEGKQILMAMSLVCLVLVAVFSNEQVLKAQRPIYIVSDNQGAQSLSDLNRAIASARPLNPLRDVEWEHRLAQRLEKPSSKTQTNGKDLEERTPASFGRPVSALDQVRFGALSGKYHISIKSINGSERIESVDYVESMDASDRPQQLDRLNFLSQYKGTFAVDYEKPVYQGRQGSTEVYALLNGAQQEVGQALVKVDEDDHFLALEFTHK